MDQTAFRKAILSDPFAEDAQVLAAANTDKDLREMLDTVRSVESGIEDLLTSAPIPPLLYERLLTLPEGDEDDGGEPEALTSINVSTCDYIYANYRYCCGPIGIYAWPHALRWTPFYSRRRIGLRLG